MTDRLAVSWRQDPDACARELGISSEAANLYARSDVIDLHIDAFIWHRLFGYDLRRPHRPTKFAHLFWGHTDFPRLQQAGVTGATWVITTNPARDPSSQAEAFASNLRELQGLFDSYSAIQLVRTAAEYRQAVQQGKHAAFVGIQGGNALGKDALKRASVLSSDLLRVTLLHLTNSWIGATSAPGASGDSGLSRAGAELVEQLNEHQIFVDLAHISKKGFWDALEVHSPKLPAIVTHTGISGVHPHWRNLDDRQLRAIAEQGGVVGVMYFSSFLGDPWWRGRARTIARHIKHAIRVAGEDAVALGSDWDGNIITPTDMPTCRELPKLVEEMLQLGLTEQAVTKVLGANFLRLLAETRG